MYDITGESRSFRGHTVFKARVFRDGRIQKMETMPIFGYPIEVPTEWITEVVSFPETIWTERINARLFHKIIKIEVVEKGEKYKSIVNEF